MVRKLPKVYIGKNQYGWFIFDTDTLKTISQYFPTKQDAKDEFYEYEDERWEYSEYNPFGRC